MRGDHVVIVTQLSSEKLTVQLFGVCFNEPMTVGLRPTGSVWMISDVGNKLKPCGSHQVYSWVIQNGNNKFPILFDTVGTVNPLQVVECSLPHYWRVSHLSPSMISDFERTGAWKDPLDLDASRTLLSKESWNLDFGTNLASTNGFVWEWVPPKRQFMRGTWWFSSRF